VTGVRAEPARRAKPSPATWIVWIVALAVATALMLVVRVRVERVHVALVYLLVVQFASVRGGRAVGLTLAGLAFLAFNWFFLPPYGTLAIANPLDWLVLVVFLATSAVSAELLYRARELGAERARALAANARAKSLEESHHAKDAILAAVSHDLRTPLTTIKGLAHELASSGDDRAEVIEAEADRLSDFVSKLLDFSRITMGTPPRDIQANEAEDLLGAALQQAQGCLEGRTVNVHIESPDALLFGRFEFAQTLRVLVNLLENAAKYSATEQPIDVGARRMGAELQFWVADRGAGVAEAERDRIFEPFYRPRGSSRDGGGAGLGLFIARGIAQAQGGSVAYASRAGGGSVFTLSVPWADLEETPAAG